MIYDVQKASMWKRISAWLLDIILLAVLAVGLGALISYVTGYDSYNQQLLASYDKYETQYGVEFEVTQEQWEAMKSGQPAQLDFDDLAVEGEYETED